MKSEKLKMEKELKIIDEVLLRFEDANLSAPEARRRIGEAILAGLKTARVTKVKVKSKNEKLKR